MWVNQDREYVIIELENEKWIVSKKSVQKFRDQLFKTKGETLRVLIIVFSFSWLLRLALFSAVFWILFSSFTFFSP